MAVVPEVWNTLCIDSPNDSLTFYTSSKWDIRAAFFEGDDLVDMTGVAKVTFCLRWGSSPTSAPLLYRQVTVNTTLTLEEWEAQTSQHATIVFAYNETGIDIGGLREARLTASWLLTAADGSVLGVVTQPIMVRVSGVEISVPMSGYYTKAESDTRYLRKFAEEFVVSNYAKLTTMDATDPNVRMLADMLCTFITSVQGVPAVTPDTFVVTNFAERLQLNGADYSLKEISDLLCTLIQDLKNKGVVE